MRRVVAIADTHCGHPTGLTAPDWQWPTAGPTEERSRLAEIQNETWQHYLDIIEKESPVDGLIHAGDCIDGRTTGRLLITHDREEQCAMAAEAINAWNAPRVVMVPGTRRHTGDLEKWERLIAIELNADIASRQFIDVDGLMFGVRHKVGRSSIPHGKATPLARAAVWNELLAARGKEPRAQIHLRAHVHYHSAYIDGPNWMAMTLPALQCSTEYGAEECDGEVHWGVVVFDVEDGRLLDWRAHLVEVKADQPEVVTL